ncbi:bifunctional rhamnulose-1-phosphate aldolase/short-chain dehydrogenase [Fulvivirgaceae bacterium BMA12]|uniref:Bifunctional rhamnulose-1-phosphate aldolase/short-chain dehydrogenase n=1 Tax=Agaribacillus aureus TaxID=3051825 RepID=A0ABT8L208_9BACT|nr:bifunctional rhamnulose-1-phosphate aldolase/short-chain dehydrogenase [Fulvivirgaceae bacterium BMA12]
MELVENSFQYVNYLWDKKHVETIDGDEVQLLLYRSNILGSDLRITNYGGGNTSCKTIEKDPVTGLPAEVMWVKGSGGDIGTLTREGLSTLYVEKLRSLKAIYRGLAYEDEMVRLFNHCLFDVDSRAPSIDTPLHAFLPFKHIDHLHPDAVIAIAASKQGKAITEELYEGQIAWIPWQRPGFDLGLQLEKALGASPDIRGIMLGGHGLFTWGETSYDCYINSLEVIEKASHYLENAYGRLHPVFGGEKVASLPAQERLNQAASLAPVLRGLVSREAPMIGHFTDDERVLEFINSHDLEKLAPLGTSCPDHFLRTKIRPLVLDLPANVPLSNPLDISKRLEPLFEVYREGYAQYYEDHKRADSPDMRNPNPVIILWPSVGMFSFAKNKQTARVAGEFYINAINVMKGAEAISEYVALPLQEAFDIEYWLLEEAKLQRMPREKPLARKIALITGGAGGIGKAIAQKLLEEGACVFLTDVDETFLAQSVQELDRENTGFAPLDVTRQNAVAEAFSKISLQFGGVDIVVNCAGLAISKPLEETTEKDWEHLQDVIVKGQFNVTKKAVEILKAQGIGGDLINIASKNALVSGPNNVGYGTAKAAQTHMSRLLAAELGPFGIRVNVVNPDAVIEGSRIWEGAWAEGRAKAYGISPEELPGHYAKRTLLNEIIGTRDIANAVFALVGGLLSKSTGNIINVDGGIPGAFVR